MAGIVAALEADDRVGAAGQPVDDLALALVAPLRPDDGNICHDAVLLNRTLKQVARARRGLSGFGRRGKGGGCWRKCHGAWGRVGGRDSDRKSVVWGQRVSVRVDLGGGGIIKEKTKNK